MHVPGTTQYEALAPSNRFEACLEALNDETSSRAPRPDVVAFFKQKLEIARMDASAADFYWALTNNLSIMTLEGKQAIFKPSCSQERVVQHVLRRLADNQAVRTIYLAARRTWKSAICANIIYEFTKRTPGCTSAVLAHRDDTLQEIFSKYEYAYAFDKLQPSTRKANTYELVFDKLRSQIKAFNANSTRAGVLHGFNPRGVHASEASHYENSHEMFSGLLIAVPSPPVSSIVLLECRGGFPEGYVYEKVKQEIQEPGSSGFDLLFDGWPQRNDATTPFKTEYQKQKFFDSLTDDERAVMTALDLKLEQVHWWRETYRSVYFHGDHAEALREWNKDNPLTPMDAFQGVDEKVFDSVKVDSALKVATGPTWVGNLVPPTPMMVAGRLHVWETPVPKAVENAASGNLSIWEEPQAGCQYVIGADIARGSLGASSGDYNVAVGICRQHRVQAFRARTRMPWVEFIDLLRLVSKHWHDAVMNIEANYRPELIGELARTDRVNCLYIRPDAKRTDIRGETGERYGWEMTAGTKRMLIHKIQEKLHYEPELFSDALLLREMQVFRSVQSAPDRDPTYRGAMGKGQHDDIVIAFGLALWADYDTPNIPKLVEPINLAKQPETIHDQWLAQVERMRRDNDAEGWDAVYDDVS
jgi:hypothetical protein